MEDIYRKILESIEKASISPQDKEALSLVVYNAMVDTVLPILLDQIPEHKRSILDRSEKLTPEQLSEMLGFAMADNMTKERVEDALTTLFDEIVILLEKMDIQ